MAYRFSAMSDDPARSSVDPPPLLPMAALSAVPLSMRWVPSQRLCDVEALATVSGSGRLHVRDGVRTHALCLRSRIYPVSATHTVLPSRK